MAGVSLETRPGRYSLRLAGKGAATDTAFDQAKARYQAGLAPIDDLAQAERLVVQAEIDDSVARLSVWRALLQLDASRGDIQPFVQTVSK